MAKAARSKRAESSESSSSVEQSNHDASHDEPDQPSQPAVSSPASSPAPASGTYTASEVRRQKTLFLADAEQFAFDFGGEASRIAETVVEDDAQQRAIRRAEELEDATARVAAAAAGHKGATALKPLTVEEVSAYVAELLRRGPRSFLTLPKAGASRKAAVAAASGASAESEEGATLAEAMPQFKAALRRYDEALWRENKRRREEEEQKRIKARKRQRA